MKATVRITKETLKDRVRITKEQLKDTVRITEEQLKMQSGLRRNDERHTPYYEG